MTLRGKTLCLVGISLATLLLVLYVFTRRVVLNNFTRAEFQNAKLDVDTVKGILHSNASDFRKVLQGYAGWDDTFRFVQTRDSQYIEKNYYAESLRLADVDFAFLMTRDGRVTALGSQNPAALGGQVQALKSHLPPNSSLLRFFGPRSINSALIALPSGPTLVATAPIVPSDFSDHVRGTLVFARALDTKRLSLLTQAMKSDVILRSLSSVRPDNTQQIGVSVEGDGRPLDQQRVVASTLLPDENGRARFSLEVRQPRELLARGVQTMSTFALVLAVAGLLFAGLSLGTVEMLVLRRLATLSKDVDGVRECGDMSCRVGHYGNDELALLGKNINTTLSALEGAHLARLEGETRLRESERLHRELVHVALTAGDAFFVAELPRDQDANSHSMSGLLSSRLDWSGEHAPRYSGSGQAPKTLDEWIDCVTEKDRAPLRAALEKVVGGEEFELEVALCHGNGSELHWIHRATLLRGKEGENDRILGACLDITERKLAERRLAQSEERLEQVLQTVADPIWIFDRDGYLRCANPDAALRVFGIEATSMDGTRLDNANWKMQSLEGTAVAPQDMFFERVKAQGAPLLEQVFSLEATPGHRVTVSVGASPLLDANRAFAGVVASVSNITESRALQERLSYQAFHDPLTGLANRQLLRNRLEHALAHRTVAEGQLAVVFLDLDNFKLVNDSLGHEMGDLLLQTVAERLRRIVRAGDTAARQGGDEFVVLLDSLHSPHHSLEITERIMEAVSEPIDIEGHTIVTPPSLGIAFYEEGAGADELLRRADAAMYEAKRRGKGRIQTWHSALSGKALGRLQLEDDLRRAIEHEEFIVFYQPKIDLVSGRMRGVEALLRWNHPLRGLVSPAEFIPIAEETGLIVPLGLWVLRQACLQGARWNSDSDSQLVLSVNVSATQLRSPLGALETPPAAAPHPAPPHPAVPLNVNVSARQLASGQLASQVAQILEETGLSPDCLILEITETALMDEADNALETLHELRALGVRLSIDDFGTGYSSLSYLRRFPFDYLKIDRQFVSRLHETPEQGAIVSSMIHLGHALGLQVVAEGTEEWPEVDHLRELGCDLAQGYLFGRPVPPEEIQALLAATSDHLQGAATGAL